MTLILLTSRVEPSQVEYFLKFEHIKLEFRGKLSRILLSSSSIRCSTRYLFRIEYFFRHKINGHKFKSNIKYFLAGLACLHP